MNQPWTYVYSPSGSPPPASLSTRSLWVFPVHQPRALVSCIQPGLVICFTLDNIHAVLSKHPTLASPTESKILSCTSILDSIFKIPFPKLNHWITKFTRCIRGRLTTLEELCAVFHCVTSFIHHFTVFDIFSDCVLVS